ncbi:hypothetical protein INT43_008995 [Umbelopsis isabellina]|uniref:Uncharacterized protein n=1 Tax=Mortierella isabellina TaxID=91625 RepID=A0A8H7PW55_MORIS|nr:hypothetical protein INT43_008995 [Umbelopsis isabellina]
MISFGILWIIWVVVCIIAVLLAVRGARRAMRARNARNNALYDVSPQYAPSYAVRNDSSNRPNPLSNLYYGAPYPTAPQDHYQSNTNYKPDNSSVIDMPPPSYQDYSKDARLPKPM